MAKRKVATRPGRAAAGRKPSKRAGQVRSSGTEKSTSAAVPKATRMAAQPTLPSSLDFDRRPSAARSGRAELAERFREHHETDPSMTGGDVDADWPSAYSVGDEAPGGDNPTPDQAVVEDMGRALGVAYADEEELQAADKIEDRDRHRWELDPASAEDYPERIKGRKTRKSTTC
ncbi:MAG TPA: DUF6335 family protein [Vicinamibacterales bacterium]|jgi:hypothetical protein